MANGNPASLTGATLVTEIYYDQIDALPTEAEIWAEEPSGIHESPSLKQYISNKTWTCGERNVYFFCDIHADADAFFLSLGATGGILRTGTADDEFDLTDEGQRALFIIGGDCFDKGPSTLRLLEVIQHLRIKGAEVLLLAGNHDVRTYLGVFYAESKNPLYDHLFVRMGTKTIPLLREIHERFVAPKSGSDDDIEYRNKLLPSSDWYEKFPLQARLHLNPAKLEKEIRRVREKTEQVEQLVDEIGLDFGDIYASVQKFKELFFDPEGPYYWFFESMKLAYRQGSYLFLHGGLDDSTAELISARGVDFVNDEFHKSLKIDPFALYHGSIGNVFRTKYRESDYEFTGRGTYSLLDSGINAIVHGHRNLLHGQRLVIRNGILNFECDASVDRNTRIRECLSGPGGAVTIFSTDGRIKGISTDYPYIKTFHPEAE